MGGKELKGAYKGLTCMHIRAEVSNFEKKKKKKTHHKNNKRLKPTKNGLH
jgi:hypothetical protein